MVMWKKTVLSLRWTLRSPALYQNPTYRLSYRPDSVTWKPRASPSVTAYPKKLSALIKSTFYVSTGFFCFVVVFCCFFFFFIALAYCVQCSKIWLVYVSYFAGVISEPAVVRLRAFIISSLLLLFYGMC